MSRLVRLQEKTQIKWGVELFNTFVLYAAKKGTISPSHAHTLREELQELAQAALGEDSPESIAEQLNHYIGMMNVQMKQNVESTKYAPFPTFSFATEGHLQSAVLDQLDMVERTLTEAAEAEIVDWEKESTYFAEILQVFSLVETKKMQPQEGMAKLSGEIEKINKTLPKEYVLPLPDLSAYE